MSDPGPGDNPFEGLPLFGDLAKMFQASGPVHWDLARQMALWTATSGQAPDNVEPLERIRFEELARVAELHVRDLTGLDIPGLGAGISVAAVTAPEWASRTMVAWRPLLEQLATGLQPPPDGDDDESGEMGGLGGLLGGLGSMLSPVLVGMQVGALIGHLGRRTLGQYDLPIPRPPGDDLLVVPATMASFAGDWSIPIDDVRLWVAVSELTHHAVLAIPHVRDRLLGLLGSYASGFRPDPGAVERTFGEIDPTDPSGLEQLFANPTALLGAMQTPEQRATLTQVSAVVAAVEGYVDWVVDTVGGRLIASYGPLTEALRRRRVSRGEDARYAEQLLGLVMDQAAFDRASSFVDGIRQRAGDTALAGLWASPRSLPTPAEIDAPGLWLARTEFDTDS